MTVISIDKLTKTLRMKQIHRKNIELLEQVKGGVLCLTGSQMDDAAAVTRVRRIETMKMKMKRQRGGAPSVCHGREK